MRIRFSRLVLLLAGSAVFLAGLHFFTYVFIDLGYLTRPLWDANNVKFEQTIVHHYAEGMSMEERCRAHGWKVLPKTQAMPKVYDAVIFSVELDMLEIRLHELWDVVDKFVIMESNATFTGLPKEQTFEKNWKRFAFAESKIVYKSVPLYELKTGEDAWINEGRTRDGMSAFLRESGIQPGDLVTSSDVDELISAHTIDLLRSCEGAPPSIHLQLRNYIYSYEFPANDNGIWQTSIHKYNPQTFRYIHSKSSDTLLTDAGWHCSFCFRLIRDFQFKMEAYSHSDRIRRKYMTTNSWIQKAICQGNDLFGMFPEAYSWKELFSRLGSIPKSQTAVALPRYVLENRDRFSFLLPGGCQRADAV